MCSPQRGNSCFAACIIGAFTTYRIMLVSGVIYIGKTMQFVGCACGLVLFIQIIIFFILKISFLKFVFTSH